MKRILILSHYFYPSIGGIETFSEMLADYLSKEKFEVRLLTWSESTLDKHFPYTIIRNPSMFKIINSHLWADFILENNPCIRLSWPTYFFKKPNMIVLQTWIDHSKQANFWKNKLKYRKLNSATEVIAISNSIKQKIYPSAKIIHNSYNEKIFKKIEYIKKEKDFGFLGRLVSDKGAELAIQAILLFNKLHKNNKTNLTIIGNGPELPKLKKLVVDSNLEDAVYFESPLRGKELVNKLNEFKYFLVPSTWEEPFGIVALEAMACGCIPIVSNKGGLPEAIGNGGLTFESGDVNSLVEQMTTLFFDDHLQNKLLENGDENLQNLNSEFIGKTYLGLIRHHFGL